MILMLAMMVVLMIMMSVNVTMYGYDQLVRSADEVVGSAVVVVVVVVVKANRFCSQVEYIKVVMVSGLHQNQS
jgi:predicted ABC-type exoprotein transport system permease subunit